MRTIWIIIPGNRVNGRVTRELFESNPCVVHYAPERGGCAFVLRFVSLFTPSSSRFVVASLLVFLTRPLSSLTTTLDTLSLLSYPTRKGLLFKFERFFFFPSSPGKDTGYSSPPFNDYAAFWCGSNRYSRGWISHLISDVNIGGKWKFRVNTTLVDKGKFLSILSSRVISIPLFNIPSVNYSSVN